jgi:dipeptidyl aminopeptidase/acylaminoacyl peptidase
VTTPERRATTIKADVDDRIPSSISLSAAEEILAYRPIESARRLTTPLMVIGVAGDATTPTDHAEQLYAAARGPKRLIMQHHTTHYAAYDRYWEQTTPEIVGWLDTYVRPADVVVTSDLAGASGATLNNLEIPA